jgi:putative cardiolipin synthase
MGLLQLILIAFAAILAGLLVAGLVLRLLFRLPALPPRPETQALDGAGTRLGEILGMAAAAHPGLSGVLLLPDGREAFAARGALARVAERSLDLQYYIWHGDVSGLLLLGEVLAAADRGVRVRLLLDDNGTAGLDRQLAALDRHPNIEVRLFNPFVIRQPKAVGYIMDFRRLNRRMHNKAFIADSCAAVIGGRNVGDAYFGASADSLFEDLDLLGAGPVVTELAADFDRYWAARSSYPVGAILAVAGGTALDALRAELAAAARAPVARAYGLAIEASVAGRVADGASPAFEWTRVTMLSDDPAKGEGAVAEQALLATRLADRVGVPEERLSLVSAYFVPGNDGCAALKALAADGIDVEVLTNALEATDVAAVHAGYARHRAGLLKAGVQLWELKAAPGGRNRLRLGIGSGPRTDGSRPVLVASGSSLHAKTFAVDGKRLFVGSFNFDPRSVALNTELGFLVESEALASALHDAMPGGVANRAYEVRLAETGRLNWLEQTPEGLVVHATEPGTRWHQRALVSFLALLPFEWLL